MAGYVWRVPMLLGVMALAALALFATGVLGLKIIHRRPSRLSKVVAAASIGLVGLLSVVAVRSTARLIARTLEISVAHVDPGPLGYAAPALFAGFALMVGRRVLQDRWTGRPAMLFYLWLLGFTAANVIDWCWRWWCKTIGFPFTWDSWTDSIGDERFREFTDTMGG